jgi:uncharacterized lipoprotein YajG
MRSPLIRVAAALFLLAGCAKKKDVTGPTYGTSQLRDVSPPAASVDSVIVTSAVMFAG